MQARMPTGRRTQHVFGDSRGGLCSSSCLELFSDLAPSHRVVRNVLRRESHRGQFGRIVVGVNKTATFHRCGTASSTESGRNVAHRGGVVVQRAACHTESNAAGCYSLSCPGTRAVMPQVCSYRVYWHVWPRQALGMVAHSDPLSWHSVVWPFSIVRAMLVALMPSMAIPETCAVHGARASAQGHSRAKHRNRVDTEMG